MLTHLSLPLGVSLVPREAQWGTEDDKELGGKRVEGCVKSVQAGGLTLICPRGLVQPAETGPVSGATCSLWLGKHLVSYTTQKV